MLAKKNQKKGHSEERDGVIRLDGRRYAVGITWTDIGKEVDLDLQAVIVDDMGHIVDAVYYNNLTAMGGAVQHTGDLSKSKLARGKQIWVILRKLPASVRMIIFVIAACNKARLKDAIGGKISVSAEYTDQVIKTYSMERSFADVDAVAMMIKDPHRQKWHLHDIDSLAEFGSHFLDILEPTLGDLIRSAVPNAPAFQRVTFQMAKGAAIDLPSNGLQRLYITASFEQHNKFDEVEVDIAAVFFNIKGKHAGAVYYENLKKYGVTHAGSSPAAEDLSINLAEVPEKIQQIFVVLTILTPGRTFADLTSASCVVKDQNLNQLAHFKLTPSTLETGLIVGRILCGAARRIWQFQALGCFCPGPTWLNGVPEMSKQLNLKPEEWHRSKDRVAIQNQSEEKIAHPEEKTEHPQEKPETKLVAEPITIFRMISNSFTIQDSYKHDLAKFCQVNDGHQTCRTTRFRKGVRKIDSELLAAAMDELSEEEVDEKFMPEPFQKNGSFLSKRSTTSSSTNDKCSHLDVFHECDIEHVKHLSM